jgi:protoporphyrinogen oxidase
MGNGRNSGLAILGGGVAGLAAGLFSRRANRPFSVFEAEAEPGGMCRTLKFGDFLVDTGAHRFHAKIPSVTALLQELLGDDLVAVNIPSEIFEGGRFVRFPLEPGNLLKARGPAFIMAAVADMLWSRLRLGTKPDADFERFALSRYGGKVARPYLLNYSEKLWGTPARQLSPAAAGSRLQGLKPSTMFSVLSKRNPSSSPHLEGTFFYPRRGGIETITRALAESCGTENIHCDSRVTRVFHDTRTIRGLEINGRETLEVEAMITTLPLTLFLEMMDPPPPAAVAHAAAGLRFRSLVLGILLLDQPDVTQAATVYFPETKYPFTRVYEPNRRSPAMSPPGKTSLVAEFPCDFGDALWESKDAELTDRMIESLTSLGWVRKDRILSASVFRLRYAYPVVTLDVADRLAIAAEYLGSFRNLALAGRHGRFRYSHIHDQIHEGHEAVEALAGRDRS